MDTPTNEPLSLRAGDTWEWRREDLADYPAPTWVLTYRFKNEAGGFEIVAAADGAAHAVSALAATTAGYAAGVYAWVAKVTSGAVVHTVDSGTFEVLPNLFAGAATLANDQRSHARKMLARIEAALEAFELGVKSYEIAGRQLTRRDTPELLVMRDKYRAEVRNEDAVQALAAGLPNPRMARVRFGRA